MTKPKRRAGRVTDSERPREVEEALSVIESNREPYAGVTIGDIHRAAHILVNYSACLESSVQGLHQRLYEIQDICKNGPLNMMLRKDAVLVKLDQPEHTCGPDWCEVCAGITKAKKRGKR